MSPGRPNRSRGAASDTWVRSRPASGWSVGEGRFARNSTTSVSTPPFSASNSAAAADGRWQMANGGLDELDLCLGLEGVRPGVPSTLLDGKKRNPGAGSAGADHPLREPERGRDYL